MAYMTKEAFKQIQKNLELSNKEAAFYFESSLSTISKWRDGTRSIPPMVAKGIRSCVKLLSNVSRTYEGGMLISFDYQYENLETVFTISDWQFDWMDGHDYIGFSLKSPKGEMEFLKQGEWVDKNGVSQSSYPTEKRDFFTPYEFEIDPIDLNFWACYQDKFEQLHKFGALSWKGMFIDIFELLTLITREQ